MAAAVLGESPGSNPATLDSGLPTLWQRDRREDKDFTKLCPIVRNDSTSSPEIRNSSPCNPEVIKSPSPSPAVTPCDSDNVVGRTEPDEEEIAEIEEMEEREEIEGIEGIVCTNENATSDLTMVTKSAYSKRTHHKIKLWRFPRGLSAQNEAWLSQVAKRLTLPGKGIIELSEDDDGVMQVFKNETKEERRASLLKVYLEAAKGGLCFYVHSLLLGEDMLEFETARKTLLNYQEWGMWLGIRWRNHQAGVEGTFEEVCEEGLDTLRRRCERIHSLGVRFVLWSAIFHVTDVSPSLHVINTNCLALARFAATNQSVGLVPVVAVELRQKEDLDLECARRSLKVILSTLVKAMADQGVYMEGMILALKSLKVPTRRHYVIGVYGQPVYPRSDEDKDPRMTVEEKQAMATSLAIQQCVPPNVAGILLMNSSLTDLYEDNEILNAMNKLPVSRWTFQVGFCYSQMIQKGFISKWDGRKRNLDFAVDFLVKRAKLCSDATMGGLPCQYLNAFNTNVTIL